MCHRTKCRKQQAQYFELSHNIGERLTQSVRLIPSTIRQVFWLSTPIIHLPAFDSGILNDAQRELQLLAQPRTSTGFLFTSRFRDKTLSAANIFYSLPEKTESALLYAVSIINGLSECWAEEDSIAVSTFSVGMFPIKASEANGHPPNPRRAVSIRLQPASIAAAALALASW